MVLESLDTKLVSRWVPSPNYGLRRNDRAINMLVLHYTSMASHDAALAWLTDTQSSVSAHYLVDTDGTITQMVSESKRAWHAGASYWAGETDINSCSVGVELHNVGPDGGYPDFPDVQMKAVTTLCLDICARRAIPRTRVLAHSDVAPARKLDPGDKFDWARLYRAGVGLWVPPVPIGEDSGLGQGDGGAEVVRLQERLAAFGYGLEVSGKYETSTEQVVAAFQRHWRQSRVDGRADSSTRQALERVGAAAKAH